MNKTFSFCDNCKIFIIRFIHKLHVRFFYENKWKKIRKLMHINMEISQYDHIFIYALNEKLVLENYNIKCARNFFNHFEFV